MSQSALTLTIIASLYTWGMTAAGSAMVFAFKDTKKSLMDAMLGFAAGIMVAAAFFSLLLPAVNHAEAMGISAYIPTLSGFLAGCGFLYLADVIIPHQHEEDSKPHGSPTNKLTKSALLVLAIILHNIPEGLAVGIAFAALSNSTDPNAVLSAIPLAIGIGIQNFPEGAAVSLPARRDGLTSMRAFMIGQLSGAVEPVAAIFGVLAISVMQPALPYAMSFAAGTMIYVVFDEIIPTAHEEGKNQLTTLMFVLGFSLMMFLDLFLG